jgi:spermidine synthase
VCKQTLKRRAIGVAQGDVLFVHVHSLPDTHKNVDQLIFQSTKYSVRKVPLHFTVMVSEAKHLSENRCATLGDASLRSA